MHPITTLDVVTKTLIESHDLSEIKEIKNKAESLRLYFRQQGDALAQQNRAAELKLRAERKLGQLLREMEMNPGGGNGSNQYVRSYQSHDVTGSTKTLSELNISKMQSFRWQQIADIPDDIFNQFLIDLSNEKEEITTQGLLRYYELIKFSSAGDSVTRSTSSVSDANERLIHPKDIPQYTQIKQGDALKVLKTMPDESIDCVVTSPPYWRLRDYGVEGQLGIEETVEEYIEKLCDIFDEIKRVLKPKGTCWVNIGDTYNGAKPETANTVGKKGSRRAADRRNHSSTALPDKCLLQIPARFSIEMCNRGWILRNEIIWHKPNCIPHSVKDRFTVDFEKIFFFTKSKRYYFEQQLEPFESDPSKGLKPRNKGAGNYGQNAFFPSKPLMSEGERKWSRISGRNKRCVWSIPTQTFYGSHFSVFPSDLIETPIRSGCPEFVCIKCGQPREKIYQEGSGTTLQIINTDLQKFNTKPLKSQFAGGGRTFLGYTFCNCNVGYMRGVVLDPFFGSGTTGIVASRLNRNWIGIEISKNYAEVARKRLAELSVEHVPTVGGCSPG